ncbi:MAG: amidohydrolase [Crocinitomicaceae bacterium]|nr:amidohydrolase [Crocinitomicaceae bacterium]MCF8434808.1 amidohydrolase [Crocinitomicaceae bacterium]
MSLDILQFIRQKSLDLFEKVKGYREHMHMYPELSYQEFETMEYVSQCLTKLGIEHEKGVGKTGIVAIIRGDHHSSEDACIGLRADLDALPIIEDTDLPFQSKNNGVMHACGHDVHTSILLGAAEIIFEQRNNLKSPVKLIFQPGEEKNPGGATLMIADGVLHNPSITEMYALHVFPEMKTGNVGFREGVYMASSDEIYITIHGKGGHGATPHQCIDPIMIGANLLVQLQQVVSRKCNPTIPSVLTFGHFEAIGATNIIPSTAIIKGTFRTMNENWRAEALSLVESQTKEICTSMGATVTVQISKGYPYLENNPIVTGKLRTKAKQILGEQHVEDLPIRMTSEDFAFYSQEIPVCFLRLGVRNEDKGIVYGVHHPKFNIDDNALITGMQVMASSVF